MWQTGGNDVPDSTKNTYALENLQITDEMYTHV